MTKFTVRVMLAGNPTEAEYAALHAAMRQRGLVRFIHGSDGKWYRLPHAEYNRVAEASAQQVLTDVKAAVRTAVPLRTAQILVTEAKLRRWDGLDQVSAEVARTE